MKNLILFASIFVTSGLLFTNLYNSIIDAKSWGSNIPNSIFTAREYFKVTDPGNFYRVFSPINQVIALIVLIVFWKSFPSLRLYMGVVLALYIFADVMTFAYFYPRNDIMFKTAQLVDTDLLKRTWSQWTMMTWVRTAALFFGVVLSFISLHHIYTLKK
jgi:hypothetical protein